MTISQTETAINALHASYYPSHFSGYARLVFLMEGLIAVAMQLAGECGADPVAELETFETKLPELMATAGFDGLRGAITDVRSRSHEYETFAPAPNTHVGMTRFCRREIEELARAGNWNLEETMRFCFRQLAIMICGVMKPGEEAGYFESILDGVKQKASHSGGAWFTHIPLTSFEEEEPRIDVPYRTTSLCLNKAFEDLSDRVFSEFDQARDGDLIGVVLRHAFMGYKPQPTSQVLASIRHTGTEAASAVHFSLDTETDIRLLALAGLTSSPAMTCNVFDAMQAPDDTVELISAHFRGFGFVFYDEHSWSEFEDDEMFSYCPVTLLANTEFRMTSAKAEEVLAAMTLLRNDPLLLDGGHPLLPDFGELSFAQFCCS